MPPALYLVALLYFPLVAAANSVNVTVVDREEHCLALAFTKKHYAFEDNSAGLDRLGCYATHGSAATAFTFNDSDPEVNSLRARCATVCQLEEHTARKAQFTFENGVCGCIPRSSFVYADAAFNSSVCCKAGAPDYCTSSRDYRVVFELELLCPLNFTLCTNLKYCRPQNGCCLPIEESPSEQMEMTSGSMLLAQWAGGLLIIAGVGHLSYLIALRRHRRLAAFANGDEPLSLRERHERRLVLPNTPVTDDSILLIGLLDLEATAGRCVDMFNKCRTPVDEGDSCTICLDEYDSNAGDAVETPCHHKFHRACIVDFIQHKLRTSLEDVSCPMCRATVLCQVIEEGSELGRLRQTILEMRHGVRPPRRPQPSEGEGRTDTELVELSPPAFVGADDGAARDLRGADERTAGLLTPPRRRQHHDGLDSDLDDAMAVLQMDSPPEAGPSESSRRPRTPSSASSDGFSALAASPGTPERNGQVHTTRPSASPASDDAIMEQVL